MKKQITLFFIFSILSLCRLDCQTIDVNVLTYNLLNFPNGSNSTLDGDSARAVLFREIIEDADADIIIVQELRTVNGTNAEGLTNADILFIELNNNGVLGKTYAYAPTYTGYGSTTFGFLGNMLFYNANLFNFSTSSEVPAVNSAMTTNGNSVFTPRPSSHYELSYPVTPICPEQIATLDIFSTHLKAGNDPASNSSISDEERRDLGAKDIVDYISVNLSSDDNIIVGGDFNFQGDFEDGYITLQNGVFGTFVDPLNGWVRNIPSQVDRYTQSTRSSSSTNNNNGGSSGGLDDRFDLWFYNSVILNSTEKISYNTGTYQTWASAGVPWNGRAGEGNSPIANQVELMSDHFPVYMQIEIDAPNSVCNNNCPISMHYPDPIMDGVYNAQISITSDATIGSNQDVTFFAGDFIELLPGFEVLLGGELTVDIQTCTP